jgi:hypothetical protein
MKQGDIVKKGNLIGLLTTVVPHYNITCDYDGRETDRELKYTDYILMSHSGEVDSWRVEANKQNPAEKVCNGEFIIRANGKYLDKITEIDKVVNILEACKLLEQKVNVFIKVL